MSEEKPKEQPNESTAETIVQAPSASKEKDEKLVVAKSLEDICIGYAKRFNGYPYISVSRLVSYDDKARDPKDISNLARRLRIGYLMSGHGDKDEFIKTFVGKPIVYIQAHAECPTLSRDGCYNNINVHGQPFKTFNVSEHVLLTKDEFVPFIIVKRGKDDFAKIEGDPYHEITPEEAMAVLHMNQDPNPEAK